jgi:hypothetical protein
MNKCLNLRHDYKLKNPSTMVCSHEIQKCTKLEMRMVVQDCNLRNAGIGGRRIMV